MNLEISRRQALVSGSVVSIAAVSLGGVAVSNGSDEQEKTTETATETYAADEISVTADVGSVSITGEDREMVELESTKRGTESALDRTTLRRNESGGSLEVTVDYERTLLDRLVSNSRPDVEIDLAVPAKLTSVALETTNDGVRAHDIETDLTVSTVNGDIDIEDVSNVDDLSSTNGGIDADVEALNDGATVETTNGDVTIGTDALEGDTTVETTNGDIEFGLGSSADATLSASTTNGDLSITTDRAEVLTNTDDELEAVVDDSTHRVEFETTNGDVTIGD